MYCVLGCPTAKDIYIFPSKKYDMKRRKKWLQFFNMVEPNVDLIFACGRHFSNLQKSKRGLNQSAIPDIPLVYNGATLPLRKTLENWRKNVIVITHNDPEFSIYRHETGVYPQNLFNISENIQPLIQVPVIKSVSCSVSTQTNTRFCGLVQISDTKDEYRLNCFYCSERFAIEKYKMFVDHVKMKHLGHEKSFKMSTFLSQDHNYSSICPSLVQPSVKVNMGSNYFGEILGMPSLLSNPILLPTLLAKPENDILRSPNISNNPTLRQTAMLANSHQPNSKTFNISLADKLINILNETILNPIFLQTEEDNILVIKNTGSDNIETSNFLANLMNSEIPVSQKPISVRKSKNLNISTSSSKHTRSIYTINHGQKDIPSRRYSFSGESLPPLPKNRKTRLALKRIAQRALKNINVFENIYKTVKTRYPKVIDSETANDSKIKDKQILNPTPLCRFLKRAIETGPKKQKSTEIVFEFTPTDIVVLLLEKIKSYPVLWEFHEQPYNKNYNKAIEELCRTFNEKWSLNITPLKMRRSLIRIFKFYRCMLPRECIDDFEEYFDKLALFLPSTAEAIPRARCAYCCVCFKKDSELRKHIIARHKSLKWPYKCHNCYERFRDIDEYELHKRLPHYEEVFKCQKCDKRFNRHHLYNKHVNKAHKQKKDVLHTELIVQNVQSKTYVYECNVCNKQFKEKTDFNRHKIYHLEKYKCHLCPKEYCSKSYLNIHLKRHRKQLDYICEVCGKAFLRQANLTTHMATHTDEKITCNICNLRMRKCSLSRHLRLVHVAAEGTIESTFRAKCYHYNKHLFYKAKRKLGRSREETPRQYKCKICKIPFERLKLLKDHNKLVHFDVKRTPCRICNIEFVHMQNLKRHYREKHKLHMYQVFKLVEQNENLNTVLTMKKEELDAITDVDYLVHWNNRYNNLDEENMRSDEIQNEIMKAVENIDKQEIKVDDDHSMNNFFSDLLN